MTAPDPTAPQLLVTALIPAFNAEQTIERALDSVFGQGLASLEVIVVDDGSVDRTVDRVRAYRGGRVRLIPLAHNQGVSAAMNAGLQAARGEFIAFLDSDDAWHPGKLAPQLRLLCSDPAMTFATCRCLFINAAGVPYSDFGARPPGLAADQIWRALLAGSCVAKPCVVARRRAIAAVGGFRPDLKVAEDQDLWIRLAAAGSVGFVDQVLVTVFEQRSSLTAVYAGQIAHYVTAMVDANLQALQERLTATERRQILGQRYTFIGRNLYLGGNLWQGLAYIAAGMRRGDRLAENLWYLITASPPARLIKNLIRFRPRRPHFAPSPVPLPATAEPCRSLLAPHPAQIALIDHPRPILLVVVDTEAEFDWSGQFGRDCNQVGNIRHQALLQPLFERYRIRPTFLLSYAVAAQKAGFAPLRELVQDGRCEIGAHLQPWENPPFTEEANARNSYLANLPFGLQREKLALLTEAISHNLQVQPIAHKAGRYGVGEHTAPLLREFGYRIDLSVLPTRNLRPVQGPDFRHSFARPYWFGADAALLELPMTVGYVGAWRRLGPAWFARIEQPAMVRCHVPSLFARLHLLERVTLTPEGMTLGEMKRLVRNLRAAGQSVFTLSYHSPSLQPGNTPYVRTERERQAFIDRLGAIIEYLCDELQTTPMTATEVLARARPAAPLPYPSSR